MSGGAKVRPSGGKVPGMHGGHKSRDEFHKPPHDPGPKRPGETAADYGQTDTYDEGVQTGSGGGGGCCASFGTLMTVIVIGIIVVVVIVLLKCTSCV
jgi:hypothetical protein